MKIQIVENMSGGVTVAIDGETYTGHIQWSTKRVEGVRASATMTVEAVAEQAAAEPEPVAAE